MTKSYTLASINQAARNGMLSLTKTEVSKKSDVLLYAGDLNAKTVGLPTRYKAVLKEKRGVRWSRSEKGHDEQAD